MLNVEQMRVQGRLVRHDLGRGIGKSRASSRQNFLEPKKTKQKHRNPIISQSFKLAPFAFWFPMYLRKALKRRSVHGSVQLGQAEQGSPQGRVPHPMQIRWRI